MTTWLVVQGWKPNDNVSRLARYMGSSRVCPPAADMVGRLHVIGKQGAVITVITAVITGL